MEARNIDGYEEVHAVRLGGAAEIVAQSLEHERFRLYKSSRDNAFGVDEYTIVLESGDYLKIMREFIRRLGVRLDSLELDRVYRGSPLDDAPVLPKDCVPGGMDADLTGRVIAIKREILSPEFRCGTHQLHIAAGGFGCSPNSRGRAVYCTNLYSGEKTRFEREDVLGVISEAALPAWAREKLPKLREPPEKESVLAKLREAQSQPKPPRKPKKRDKSEPEL
jgi:hypothetical protein